MWKKEQAEGGTKMTDKNIRQAITKLEDVRGDFDKIGRASCRERV